MYITIAQLAAILNDHISCNQNSNMAATLPL